MRRSGFGQPRGRILTLVLPVVGFALFVAGILVLFLAPQLSARLITLLSVFAGVGFSLVVAAGGVASSNSATRQRQSDETARQLRAIRTEESHPDLSKTIVDEVVQLTGIDLRGSRLVGIAWRGPILDGANLASTTTETDLTGALLSPQSAIGSVFVRARLVRARLEGDFADADFRGVLAVGCDFRKAFLRHACFDRPESGGSAALLRDGQFGGNQTLAGVEFSSVNAEGAVFRGARISDRTRFDLALLSGADFRGARLGSVSLRRAAFADVTGQAAACFDGTHFESGCDFGESWIGGVDFSRTTGLEHVSFEGAYAVAGRTKFPSSFDPGVALLE